MLKLLVHTSFGLVLSGGLTHTVGAGPDTTDEQTLLANTRQLTFEGRRAGEGYFSADGKRMIFQSEREPGNPFYQIYLLDLETGDIERVSPGSGKTTCAWIHPAGNRVLYASTHDDPRAQAKMRAELDFRASGQQRRYAWDYDEQFDIYAQGLATGEPVNLTGALGYDAEGAYSPDGLRIVFASNRRAYTGEMTAAEAELFEHDKSFMRGSPTSSCSWSMPKAGASRYGSPTPRASTVCRCSRPTAGA